MFTIRFDFLLCTIRCLLGNVELVKIYTHNIVLNNLSSCYKVYAGQTCRTWRFSFRSTRYGLSKETPDFRKFLQNGDFSDFQEPVSTFFTYAGTPLPVYSRTWRTEIPDDTGQ